MGSRNATLRTDSILPTFRGVYLERFLRLIEAIDGMEAIDQRQSVCGELKWLSSRRDETLDRLKYRGMMLVLRDLLGQGWVTRFRQRSLFLCRPDYTRGKHLHLDPVLVKAQIRAAYQEERLAKICEPSTVRFIGAMEEPGKGKRPVSDLIADGRELAAALSALPPVPTAAALRSAVQPYLQLVRGESRDAHTGHKLIDIWRYFRYSWALPYQPTPGRNLFYLVRDAARAHHPVMGIAALGNCVVQMSVRDSVIGWNVESVEQALQRRSQTTTRELPKDSPVRRAASVYYLETERQYRNRVQRYAATLAGTMGEALRKEFSQINPAGLVTEEDFVCPTDAVVRRLLLTAHTSERERREDLRRTHESGERVKRTESRSSVSDDTESPLYVKKRAQALADIVFARLMFQRERLEETPLEGIRRLLQSEDGRKALRIALHSNKKSKIGCNMMDIVVCGAIPPYGELLGGKLVAMLMASPQVVCDYRELYGGQPGQIASRLAGEPVIRPADLVFLTTTSLYHVGSSQYERIRIPGPRGRQITFDFIGHTEGYGLLLLSSETTGCLGEIAVQTHGMRRVNNIFGEGVSPRLRTTREGLALIGIPQELVLRHNCPRLIYGIRLATNAFEYLRGEAEAPQYVFPPGKREEGTQAIIDHWARRWLLPRSKRAESMEKVVGFDKASLCLSREVVTARATGSDAGARGDA